MRFVPAILLAVAALPAAADPYEQRPGGAKVYYSSSTTPVEITGVEHELDSSRFMLDYAESANDWLYLGFAVGIAFDDLPTAALVADTEPAGYAAGVFAGARFLPLGPFAFTAEARYQRIYAEGSGATQDAVLRYGETTGRFGAVFRWQKLELGAGAYSLRLDGEAESTGGVVGTAEFDEVEQGGAYASLRLAIDGGYTLGLEAESGGRESFAFTFSTRF